MQATDVQFVKVGAGEFAAFWGGMEVGRLVLTPEDDWLVALYAANVDMEEVYVESLLVAQLVVWGALSASRSNARRDAASATFH